VGTIKELPAAYAGRRATGPLRPLEYFRVLEDSTVVTWSAHKHEDESGTHTTFTPTERKGSDLLKPGGSFKGLVTGKLADRLDFASLMLALFCGTASLPHILIRYYTVKDAAAARRSTVVGIAAIGAFYVLTLYLGLGAMTSGVLDPTDSNMAAPLLAKSFSETLFAIISAIAFTTVLGTVSGLIMAGSGAVAHDLLENVCGIAMTDHEKVRCGKIAAVGLGVVAMALGILFKSFNVSFLVGWAFNIAASANLPALVMLLFWPRTTKQGIVAAVTVGMLASLGWILLSADTFEKVYGLAREAAPVPFSQPGLVTIPLGFLVLVVVSLLTPPPVPVRR
jgi:cation/acetate symporter